MDHNSMAAHVTRVDWERFFKEVPYIQCSGWDGLWYVVV